MKQFVYILFAFLVVACAKPEPQTKAEKEKALGEYKTQLYELKQKIAQLEGELNKESAGKEDVVNIAVKSLEAAPFIHHVEVPGTVEADLDINVSPEASGEVIEIKVAEGEWVKKDQVIALLNTEAIERNIDELKINLKLAETTFDRQNKLWKQNIGSEIEFLQAKTSKEALEMKLKALQAQLDMAIVRSPIAGTVDIIYQKKGQIASPQAPFAKIVNINKVKIYADLSENYVTKVRKGNNVTLAFPALNKQIKASIFQVGNTIDAKNRTFRVRMNLTNTDRLIKPNMIANLQFSDYQNDSAISIPSLLIKEDFNGKYVFLAQAKGQKWIAAKKYIKTGMSNNNITEITEGLTAGEKIISEGQNMVSQGTVVAFK
ncbi:efflux RND transporter periplasmic adaptor subunit [Prolixibacteraceae bacterium JC049]|nr:efflux RND transporter periplasmic adaptor subunit [Prolixibacteraceae bacterium JC049]